MTNFDFVRADWPEIAAEAMRAEVYTHGDPRSSMFYARRTVELMVTWLYRADATLRAPYKDDLASLLHEPKFKQLVGPALLAKMNFVRKRGNDAVHRATALRSGDSIPVIAELFHVMSWLSAHYSTIERSDIARVFDASLVPKPQPGLMQKTRADLAAALAQNDEKDRRLTEKESESADLREQIAQLQAQISEVKAQNARVPDTHDYDEESTRDRFIDVLLREAGWDPTAEDTAEYPVTGLVGTPSGTGSIDYVLWGADGKPLGLIEAKRTKRDARAGLQQAKLYADALQAHFGQRPVIFASNGYEHWIWDDLNHPSREIQGFYTRDELALLIQRRTVSKRLGTIAINDDIASRGYQHQAIRAVTEAFERDHERRALLAMATGSGKTRTVIALVDVLAKANWAKRVLFLADRVTLVNQAASAFKALLPELPTANLVTERSRDARVYVSTYPTMMGVIDQGDEEQRRFGSGYFDLIVIDEAHRSVYQKYGAIFEYFDAPLVGLTATPKDEVDHNTYRLFHLEDGVPTYSYDLAKAIADGYLVPPVARTISSGFIDRGIRYDDLTDDEKEAWDLAEWDEDGAIPDRVDAGAVNLWLFNEDTVDTVLQILMSEGRKVAAGDRLGKTIIFAKNNAHAQFIADRFDANYPEHAGHFARVITHRVERAQTLIEDFAQPDKAPHIAISVDMLDTGVDVPEVVNLIFFKPVFSKSKYWQMIGRGTRLRPDLYVDGDDKKDFVVFDVGGNIEYFNQQIPEAGASATRPLRERLFLTRLNLLRALDQHAQADGDAEVRREIAEGLQGIVAGMHEGNFLVRPSRRLVEKFTAGDAWQSTDLTDAEALAALPSSVHALDTDEKAKKFDLLMHQVELSVLVADPVLATLAERVRAIVSGLGEQRSIPVVAAQTDLLDAMSDPSWWTDITVPMLESARKKLRGLVYLIEERGRRMLFTDFADDITISEEDGLVYDLPGVDRQRFREKLFAHLRKHENHVVLRKLRSGKQLTELDLDELQRLFSEDHDLDVVELAEIDRAAVESRGLGLFVRSLVGLDRSVAQDAMSAFIADRQLTARQIGFVDLVVSELSRSGSVSIEALYDPPFDALAASGPEDIFTETELTRLDLALKAVTDTARAPRTA